MASSLRAEKVERSCEHNLDRGGLRRSCLRGRENVQKRYLIQVAAYNLGPVMRALLGAGTPKAAAARGGGLLWLAACHRRARHPHHRAAKHPTRPDFVNGLLANAIRKLPISPQRAAAR